MFWMYFTEDGQVANYEGDEWPLPDNLFSHPRSAGTFAKVLRSYVRERGILSLRTIPSSWRRLTPAWSLGRFSMIMPAFLSKPCAG